MFETGHEKAEVGRLLAVLQVLDLRLVASTSDDPPAPAPALRQTLRDYDQGNF